MASAGVPGSRISNNKDPVLCNIMCYLPVLKKKNWLTNSYIMGSRHKIFEWKEMNEQITCGRFLRFSTSADSLAACSPNQYKHMWDNGGQFSLLKLRGDVTVMVQVIEYGTADILGQTEIITLIKY